MASARAVKRTSGASRPHTTHTLGFGVPASSDPHHFKIVIPPGNTGRVQISEYLGLQTLSDDMAVLDRVLLDRTRWAAIRAEVQRAFNSRLAEHELKPSAWKVGENAVDRLLGKELCVLAWAVEQMESEKIPVAVRNWLALRPEERWWLFGMTAISTGGVTDAGRGWRIALQHALGDVAQSDLLSVRGRRRVHTDLDVRSTLELFTDDEP
jgi:hypothetical protein